MAMKKDDDKSKRTLSGKKPATFGGANSKLIKPKPTALTSPGPRATPSRPMGKDATGERNWDKSSSSRVMVSAGPATMSMGGKTDKSKGGMDMSKGKVQPKKSSSPSAKMSSGGTVAPSTAQGSQKLLAEQKASAKKSRNIALGIGGTMLGAGIAISGKKIGEKIGQAAKYIANTKERKTAKRAQKAENDAIILERNKGKAKVKASKSTMKKLKGQ
jgi:hypothetical protein